MSENKLRTNQKLFWVLSVLIGLGFSLVLAVSIYPPSLSFIRDRLKSDKRIILSAVEADLFGNGTLYNIVKVKTLGSISLEIFEKDPIAQSTRFLKRIILNESRDGYFHISGNATNLAVTNVDDDPQLEIVTSTFDDNLVPRMSAFKFDLDKNQFIKIGPQ